MRIAAQKINQTGYTVIQSEMYSEYIKYVKQYNKYCSQLFDLGYITSPSLFDEAEFWSIFFEEYPNLTKLFVHKRTGEFIYTKSHINYALRLLRGNTAYDILQKVRYVLDAKQAIDEIGEFYNALKLRKKTKQVHIKPSLTVSRTIYNTNKYNVVSPYIQKCLHKSSDTLHTIDFSLIILDTLLVDLGIKRTDDTSLFLGDKFNLCDDCAFLDLLLTGEIRGTGKYGDLLFNTIEAYYKDYYESQTTKATVLGFYDELYIKATQKCIDYINSYRDELYSKGYVEYFLNPTSVVFIKLDSTTLDTTVFNSNLYIGSSLIDYCDGYSLNTYNRLLGLSGEFIAEVDVEKYNYEVTGIPITVIDFMENKGKTTMVEMSYYPICCVKQRVNNTLINISPKLTIHNVKSYKNHEDILKELEVDSFECLADEISKLLGEDRKSEMIGLLVQALICVECDYTLEGHSSPNHVKLPDENPYSYDAEYFKSACAEAQSVFKKLGF